MAFHSVITIRNDTRYLSFLRSYVAAAIAVSGRKHVSRRALQALSLSLIEAVDNAIFHASHRALRGKLSLRVGFAIGDKKIVLSVADRGKGFSWPVVERDDLLANHGRGLLLMRRLMTAVTTRRAGRWHIVTMILQQ